MYGRGYNYGRRPYTVATHEEHSPPPPLSHHPYVYPSNRYPTFNSYSSGGSGYPPATPATQYNYAAAYYNEPRTMEIEPREDVIPAPLHHLPMPIMSDHGMPLDHNCTPHGSTSCEQGNSQIL